MQELGDDGRDEQEVPLSGGNMSEVVRRGQTVHRTAGPWTSTIHRLLDHLATAGIGWLPRPLGLDDRGREVLTYLPGTVPAYPMPPWVWSAEVLTEAAGRLALLHHATARFDLSEAVWQLPARSPVEVVCLNDVAPYNMVFDDDHRLSGFIDVDTASPGPRVWDLAYLAYRLVPLTPAEDTGAGAPTLAARRERLRQLCLAYGAAGDRVELVPRDVLTAVVDRLVDLAAFTDRRAAEGARTRSPTTPRATAPTPPGSGRISKS
ncbi:aminoglycoside phosphotransferase family protein [uncultured Friedmanniella sp.]|uniref:aminoglycoside phosphotransferase family protein n=1 Tax=uncultured Friedmanniella sp. TaxID=335381 RepID=UPI0035CC10E2